MYPSLITKTITFKKIATNFIDVFDPIFFPNLEILIIL